MENQHQDREEILGKIVARVEQQVDPARRELAEHVVRLSYTRLPLSEIVDTPLEALAGPCITLLETAQEREPDKPKLRLFTPDAERDGWSSARTVLQIVTDDMPFLVDSVSALLNSRGYDIRAVIHPQIVARRDENGKLQRITEERGTTISEGVRNESMMHFEIRPIHDEEREQLEEAVLSVLADVRLAVRDWVPMRQSLLRLLTELEATPPPLPPVEIKEARTFLRWVDDHHFTMLGYYEYQLEEKDGDIFLHPIEGSGLGLLRDIIDGAPKKEPTPLPQDRANWFRSTELIQISKSTLRATVHRTVHMDILSVKRFERGRVVGEVRFIGLFASRAYSIDASEIPLVRLKVDRVLESNHLLPASHDAKALRHIVETYPRDELFQISVDDLNTFALRILDLHLRPRLALMVRKDEGERFVSCLLFVPRDQLTTRLRLKMQDILEEVFNGTVTAFFNRISDSSLAQLRIILQINGGRIPEFDEKEVEARLGRAIRSWTDILDDALHEAFDEGTAYRLNQRWSEALPASYQEHIAPESAVEDLRVLGEMGDDRFALRIDTPQETEQSRFQFRTFERGEAKSLSEVLPKLENMGLRVVREIPFEIRLAGEESIWLRTFDVESEAGGIHLDQVGPRFKEAFVKVWFGEVENDRFNQLVPRAGLHWREVVLLRALCKYLRQTGIPFSQRYMQTTLARHAEISRSLVELFAARFDPELAEEERFVEAMRIIGEIQEGFDRIARRDEDLILRRFLNLIESTLRTNFYQRGDDGEFKSYVSIKLAGDLVDELPAPRPMYEIFVYSTTVEAVHLRGGKVARGGIRWSDRREDFRTEILGLVKSQMVKNAVIVPVGSKGGFVVKQGPPRSDRDAWWAYGIEGYKTMIRGMLDVTDNLVDGDVVPPEGVVRRDQDDPYLVVAADKGTATFSDIANNVAVERGFWLGDAFASGGSNGYDHKKMGITARGGWESVKRHFREMGKDIQSEPFTAVGVGDMSGDVFGNGMLLSEQTRLLAAFNHLHVFVDPNPDPATSFAERQRLFDLPRSTWDDYDREALSEGGDVFDRSAKTVRVSPQVREAFGLTEDELSPDALIQAILRAEIELLWFGGIGTYVKAAHETHAQVGDHHNDDLRVDGSELRCLVIGEGANLGATQAGRIEFALAGGRVNTDFIDNSGGVDCSDHEVNIKIALAHAVETGALGADARNELLRSMTDEVGDLVLVDNYQQTQAITLTQSRGVEKLDEQARLMVDLERSVGLDRRLEGLPGEADLAERRDAKRGLTRPEIAVLLAYSKIFVYNELLDSSLPDEPQLVEDLVRYFPVPMHEAYREQIEQHRLRREIIATHVTNSILNRVGPTFIPHVARETGCTVSDIARAYTAARDLLKMRAYWHTVEGLDNQISADLQTETALASSATLERATRWLLRFMGPDRPLQPLIERLDPYVADIAGRLDDLLPPNARQRFRRKSKRLQDVGVPEELASRVAGLAHLHSACDVAWCAAEGDHPVELIGEIYFRVGEIFGFDRLRRSAASLPGDHAWDQTAAHALVEDLDRHQASLTQRIVEGEVRSAKGAIDAFLQANAEGLDRLRQLLLDFDSSTQVHLAMLAVAERQLRRLAEG